MRLTVLASGSKGNALCCECHHTSLLIECGLSLPQIKGRLAKRRITIQELDAVLISHEHADHTRGLPALKKEAPSLECYMSRGTADGLPVKIPHRIIEAAQSFHIDTFTVTAHRIVHDANEPLGFTIESNGQRIGYLSDLGVTSAQLVDDFKDLDCLIIESNYCERLLYYNTFYPPDIKARIRSERGHLSNDDMAAFLTQVASPRLTHVVLIHLSENNNTPELAQQSARAVLPAGATKIHIATQHDGCDWIAVG